MSIQYEKLERCYEYYRSIADFHPRVGLILGSGLGGYAKNMHVEKEIPYREIPDFPVSTVQGHDGRFLLGWIGKVPVVVMKGRVHYYEGYSMEEVVLPVRLMKKIGIEILFLTNASGGINPELAAAREISRLIKFPSAIKIDTFAKGRVEIMKFRIPEMSILHSMKVYEVTPRTRCDVLICAVERGDDVIIPNGSFELQSGDKVSFVASPNESMKFFHAVGIENNSAKTVLLAGGGKITYYLAKMLEDTPIKMTIIERDLKRCEFLSAEIPRAMVIHGDASNQQLLLEEGIRHVEAFAALTGFDEENIMLSLYAGRESKAKLITKVNRIAFEDVIDSMNLGSVIYPKLITADLILQYVRAMQNSLGSNVETLYKIVANRAEALEFRVGNDAPMIGVPLEKLSLKKNLLVACINRNGRILTQRGKDTIEVGDTVIIVTTNTGLNDLKDILA